MPAKRAPATTIPDDFCLDENTLAWLERRYPQVDAELAVERFMAWASELCYANWQRTFQNYIFRTDDDGRLKQISKRQKLDIGMWDAIEAEAIIAGFRKRLGQETVEQFRAALEAHKARNAGKVVDLMRNSLKAMP